MAVITKNNKVAPFVKWAGGKTQLLDRLTNYTPRNYFRYIEPFLGGGAFFFHLQPKKAILIDSNEELINCFRIVQTDVNNLITLLQTFLNSEQFYYEVREQDPTNLSKVERAARFIYLNRTCYNGLYRVNKQGKFNVPFGRYKNPTICDEPRLINANKALKNAVIECMDYKEALKKYAKPGDFIYFDPPYYPVSRYSDFKRYTKEFFYEEDHIELANIFRHYAEIGCFVLLTNSNCEVVRQLYNDFEYSIVESLRLINKDPSKRNKGQDLIISATKPKKKTTKYSVLQKAETPLLKNFPGTRFMGSKYTVLPHIWEAVKDINFTSVLDLFSGSTCVSYMFKQKGKEVISNDFLTFCYHFANAIIMNNKETLSESDMQILLSSNDKSDDFIYKTFKGLYFLDDENHFLDNLRTNITLLESPVKKSLALAAITRACLKKRPRGVFTYVGNRYDDGRKDLQLSLQDHFLNNIDSFNNAVFTNNRKNKAFNEDAFVLDVKADLVYIDPPYFSPRSDNDYTRRYHFVEGYCRNWIGLDIQKHTQTKKFKKYETPFSSLSTVYDAFEKLFERFKDSIIVVSYSSNALPTKNELASLLKEFKKKVDVYQIGHKYSFANQGFKTGDIANDVFEYLFVGH